MRPDDKSDSFRFQRNTNVTASTASDSKINNCRRKLQDKFDKTENGAYESIDKNDGTTVSLRSFSSIRSNVLPNGMSEMIGNVRTAIRKCAQKFKMVTKRRQILEEGPITPNCATPQTYSRAVLGRTPATMYSPFTIDTPRESRFDKENLQPDTPASKGKTCTSWYRKRNLLDDISK